MASNPILWSACARTEPPDNSIHHFLTQRILIRWHFRGPLEQFGEKILYWSLNTICPQQKKSNNAKGVEQLSTEEFHT